MTPNSNLDLQAAALQSLAAASQPIYADADRFYHAPSSENVWQLISLSAPAKTHSNTEGFTADEKFALLSAYLDDEVSEQERCLVEQWLLSDAQTRQHYRAQNRLRQGLRANRCFYGLLAVGRRP